MAGALPNEAKRLQALVWEGDAAMRTVAEEALCEPDFTRKVLTARTLGVVARATAILERRLNEIAFATGEPAGRRAGAAGPRRATTISSEVFAQHLEAAAGELDPVLQEPGLVAITEARSSLASTAAQFEQRTRAAFPDLASNPESSSHQRHRAPFARPAWLRDTKRPDLGGSDITAMAQNPVELRRLLHFLVVDVEFGVLDICAHNILEASNWPLAFRLDMARQAWDEARHAVFLTERVRELGGYIGEFASFAGAVKNHLKLNSVVERLAAQQVASEGNGVDAAMALLQALRASGDKRSAQVFEVQNDDEMLHCQFGNTWVLWSVGGDTVAYEVLVRRVADDLGIPLPGSFPVATERREIAGYPDSFLAGLTLTPPT